MWALRKIWKTLGPRTALCSRWQATDNIASHPPHITGRAHVPCDWSHWADRRLWRQNCEVCTWVGVLNVSLVVGHEEPAGGSCLDRSRIKTTYLRCSPMIYIVYVLSAYTNHDHSFWQFRSAWIWPKYPKYGHIGHIRPYLCTNKLP